MINTRNSTSSGDVGAASAAGPSTPADSWLFRARNLCKAFGTRRALSDVSLELAPGESLAIMGPSGSGKSTLLHALAGIISLDSGNVFVSGRDKNASSDLAQLSDSDRSALRLSSFGFVFQQAMLLPELTVGENVSLPLLLRGESRPVAMRATDTLLSQLGMQGAGRRRPGQLSGGEAQRVAIARALVTEPSIVFADEPTGALDSQTARDVLTRLLRGATERGSGLVLVTHDTQVASRCDRTVELVDGRIVGTQ